MNPPLQSRLRRRFRALMVVAGLACLAGFALLLYKLDVRAVLESLAALGRVWPVLLLLELGRVGCEVLTTRVLLGSAGTQLPALRLLRGQLLGQTFDVLFPLGRTSAETAKAVLYSRYVGWPVAGAVATTLQLAVLGANCSWVIASYLPGRALGLPTALRAGLIAYASVTFAIVASVVLFAATPVARRLSQRVPALHAGLERLAHLLLASPRTLLFAVLSQLLARSVQASQLALIATALGAHATPARAYTLEAVYMVGAALGEFVPAQLGTADAALVVAAPALGLSAVAAFSTTLALRAAQVLVALAAALGSLGLWWLEERRAEATRLLTASE